MIACTRNLGCALRELTTSDVMQIYKPLPGDDFQGVQTVHERLAGGLHPLRIHSIDSFFEGYRAPVYSLH
jgi:hypothetical protein